MGKPKNFLDLSCHSFSDNALAAAQAGKFENAKPLINQLIRAQEIARGAAVVARMHIANTAQEDAFGDGDDGVEPPVCMATMHALSSLVAAACESLTEEIDGLARWAEKHRMPPAVESAAPSSHRPAPSPKKGGAHQ